MVESELAAAGLPWTVLAGAAAVVGVMAAVYLVVDSVAPWWAGLLALYGGWRAVQAFLVRRRGQRVDAFVAQLPGAHDLQRGLRRSIAPVGDPDGLA